jgi:hypothetical protein
MLETSLQWSWTTHMINQRLSFSQSTPKTFQLSTKVCKKICFSLVQNNNRLYTSSSSIIRSSICYLSNSNSSRKKSSSHHFWLRNPCKVKRSLLLSQATWKIWCAHRKISMRSRSGWTSISVSNSLKDSLKCRTNSFKRIHPMCFRPRIPCFRSMTLWDLAGMKTHMWMSREIDCMNRLLLYLLRKSFINRDIRINLNSLREVNPYWHRGTGKISIIMVP